MYEDNFSELLCVEFLQESILSHFLQCVHVSYYGDDASMTADSYLHNFVTMKTFAFQLLKNERAFRQ